MAKKKLTIEALKEDGFDTTLEELFGEPRSADMSSSPQRSLTRNNKDSSNNSSTAHTKETGVKETGSAQEDKKNKARKQITDYISLLPIDSLVPHKHHSYKVLDNEDMDVLVESVKENGIFVPLSVREVEGNRYEIMSGHRRKRAAEIVGIKELPCIIFEDIDDDTSDIYMVDSNAQREIILPSERARSYKVKYEALKRQGKRSDINLLDGDEESLIDGVADNENLSGRQVHRFIRLTELEDFLLDLVDEGKIGTTAGYILSFLSKPSQRTLVEVLQEKERTISTKQAQDLRKAVQNNALTSDRIISVLDGQLKVRTTKPKKPKFSEKSFKEDFPEGIASAPIETRISFTKDAIAYYIKYISEHPEEINVTESYNVKAL